MSGIDVAVFDVNETLSDLEALRVRFEEVGAPGYLLEAWFAGTLRDGFALMAAGGYATFRTIAIDVLGGVLSAVEGLDRGYGDAAEHIVSGLAVLDLHPDVAPGLRRLREQGVRLVTLTNGDAALTGRLLERGGVADLVERCLSVDEVGRWKPAAEPYHYAARECGVTVDRMALIAVHPWDVDGARRAGLRGGWLNRRQAPYPAFFEEPDAVGSDIVALGDALVGLDS